MPGDIVTVIKLQIPGGQANPAPPVGPALGQHSVNIMEFCKAFNAQTADQNGRITPVEISVYEDRSFTFITKTPPAAVLIKEAIGLSRASSEPNREKVGILKSNDLRSIAETKMPDLNARDIDAAMKIVAGTARSMGVLVQGVDAASVLIEFENAPPPEEKPEEEGSTDGEPSGDQEPVAASNGGESDA